MIWHMAAVFEAIAKMVPDQFALNDDGRLRTWRDYEDRAARLASALVARGIAQDAKVAIFAHNSGEYLEAQFAIFKARAVPINVNYRYVEDELAYLFDNADVEAVFFDACFAPRIAAIRERLPLLKTFIRIDDGTGQTLPGAQDYEELIASHAPLTPLDYSEDDIFMLYTGGTTGMPKGVMYRHADLAGLIAWIALSLDSAVTFENLFQKVRDLAFSGSPPVLLPASPLMHGTGMLGGAFPTHFTGGTVATTREDKFDPHGMWTYIAQEKITDIVIVGDAFAKPLLAALGEAAERGKPYDLSALARIWSSGLMFSMEVKLGLIEHLDIEILDLFGSSEGTTGMSVVSRGLVASGTSRFELLPASKVLDEDDEEVVPGSGQAGMIACGGYLPIGYYKDPEKTSKTFRTIRGDRYSFPGDFARIEADGSLVLLGRGSMCINTGGEKVFPEEVEEVLKVHDSVWDALVVGVPDDRFGERIVAVLSVSPGRAVDKDELLAFARTKLAAYKLPRQLVVVKEVRRAANGKSDYKWAKEVALAGIG